jgi:uncharacterized protein
MTMEDMRVVKADEYAAAGVPSDERREMFEVEDFCAAYTPERWRQAEPQRVPSKQLMKGAKRSLWRASTYTAGGTTDNAPQDHGFMYGHGFQDLDDHMWEIIYMEPSAINQG